MPRFLNTRGNRPLAIAICDRCHLKFAWTELSSDPNNPGLRVCKNDRDIFDPWRLPAPPVENIALPWARPDEKIVAAPSMVTEYEGIILGDGDIPLSP